MTGNDLYWIAGFMKGEASFSFSHRTLTVSVPQKYSELLDRLVNLIGSGKIYRYSWNGYGGYGYKLHGVPAAELMLDIYPMMSLRRREQISKSLCAWGVITDSELLSSYFINKLDLLPAIYWTAGFIDGEGDTKFARNMIYLHVPQNNIEPLEILKSLFGGTISNSPSKPKQNHWYLNSNYAAGLLMTLFPLMSSKRQNEYKNVLLNWKQSINTRDGSKFKTHCDRGHSWIPENWYENHGRKWCKICRRMKANDYKRAHRIKIQPAKILRDQLPGYLKGAISVP
jgi:hypothetical protein